MPRHLIDPPEPNIVGKCTHCDAELYAGCDYLQDRSEIEWYCHEDCYLMRLYEAGDIATETYEEENE